MPTPMHIETAVVGAVLHSAVADFPMTKRQVLMKIGWLVHSLGIETQFKKGVPGDKYWRGLRKRFPQKTIRSPECCRQSRLKCMSEDQVSSYFKELHKLMDNNRIIPSCLWNMDETGLQYQHKPVKSVAPKGMKAFYGQTRDSKESVTIVACVSTVGETTHHSASQKVKQRGALSPLPHI